MTRLLVVSLIGAVLATAPVSAQLCDGSASFAQSPVQLSAAGGVNTDAKFFGGGLAFGGSGLFVEATGAKTNYELGGSSSLLGAGLGYQFPLDPKGQFHFCPLFSVIHSSGPHDFDAFNNGILWDQSQTSYTIGVGIGAAAILSSHVKFLPFGSLAMVTAKVKTTNQNLGRTTNTTETGSLIEFGFGVLFNDAFSFRPSLGFATDIDRTVTAFGLSMTVNVGRRGAKTDSR
jgi:hypothetical protein